MMRRHFWHLLAEVTPAAQPDLIQQHFNSFAKSHLSGAQEEKSDKGMTCWKDLPVKWQVGQ